jgi:hypothetical protein
MAMRIFDRETLLDLVVNAVPLFIMGFFVVAFVLFAPFGFDPLASLLQFGIVIGSFVALLVLTYVSAKAIAGAEKTGPVFLPGQTTPAEATPIEGHHGTDGGGDHAERSEPTGEPELLSEGADADGGAEDAEEATDDGEEPADDGDNETRSA